MADLMIAGNGMWRLNSHNYGYWQTCMESYLQGHDLWEVIAGTETTPPENAEALRKWRIKVGKAMFVLKTTIEEDLVEHIRDAKTPKEAWDTLAKLFSRKNEARLQLLENELADEKVSEARMRRIIIHGLRPEYNGFMAAVMGWPTQPSVVELENLLANQEELAKQMGSITFKERDGEDALFTYRKKSPLRSREAVKEKWTKDERWYPRESNYSGGAQRRKEDQRKLIYERRKKGECFNCGKSGHLARDCWSPKKHSEKEVVTMADVVLEEEEWDAQEGLSMMEDEVYFVEDLTQGEHPSIQGVDLEESREDEDEEEWDAEGGSFIEDLEESGEEENDKEEEWNGEGGFFMEDLEESEEEENDKEEEWNSEGGFFMEDLEESGEEENDDEEECDIENGLFTEVRNLKPMHELPVFGYDNDDGDLEDHEDKPKKQGLIHYVDEKPREKSKYNGDGDGTLVVQDDPSMKVMENKCMDQLRVKESQRSQHEAKKHEVWRTKPPDLRYVRGSLSQVFSYMEIKKAQVWIRTKKRTELQKCNEVKKNSMHEEKKKVRNGRAQKIQGHH
ncbi:uncharacterized protein LOC112272327 [Brachypodium distachyon]|uniref:CCHC-type domain-containing protein n=1 Tax=Brachypodium distachyon TaxID=15368 RepID=A0A2K2CTW6_BRADI|nr:uncharacterized protein LOC112272327 [Brachypodium distachyon]PNT65456.1 hypothetical protein BRADI_4g42727v3 [Brachypodium distachyon]|eukprot:XP_024318563.1 uncharacterized protein LOC112272327 [Brachypodium distachyon]